jgi:predicted transcriptional regulator
MDHKDLANLTANVVSAFASKNSLSTEQLTSLIPSVFESFRTLGQPAIPEAVTLTPAVPIRKSVTPEFIICLEDGKKLKMLKRHLKSSYNMTPEDYRAKWGLPSDYPMVAPKYAEARSAMAKSIGLGKTTNRQGTGKRSRVAA